MQTAHATGDQSAMNGELMNNVTCQICGANVPHVGLHLRDHHKDVTVEMYQERFPGAQMISDALREKMRAAQAERAAAAAQATQVNMEHSATTNVVQLQSHDRKVPMHELFGLGNAPGARNALGNAIELTVLGQGRDHDLVPSRDEAYIFNIDLLKQINVALERNIPMLVWGYHGTGKTTGIMQVCARVNRPIYRVQHTINMIESDVVGGWRAKDGNTYFDLGPLPLAMLNGWVYIADEYDRAPPGVTAVYQAVMEREPLVIKEAPPEQRVIRPHKNFRFVATANTNGSGDDSGLYAGTLIGDAANYSRFGITERAPYLPPEAESALVQAKHALPKAWADDLVRWAGMIREAFEAKKITATVGPREVLYSAEIGSIYGNMRVGINSAIINRMCEVDRVVASELAQRVFG